LKASFPGARPRSFENHIYLRLYVNGSTNSRLFFGVT
jgi:hypothetical protein